MKVIILAGGKGSRLLEYTKRFLSLWCQLKKPILIHIMSHYAKYGFKDFIIATGFKHEFIKKYFQKRIKRLEY